MKFTRVALAMMFALVLAQSANAEPEPKIEILYPHAFDIITDYPIYIETKVTNCTLEPPVQYWSAVEKANVPIGHIHYTIDNSPIFATKSTKVVLAKPAGKPLPLGKHILRAELVYINHEQRNPPVFAEIPIMCERPQQAGSQSAEKPVAMDDRARHELEELEKQLKAVQEELTQLKSQVHEVPNP